MTGHRSIPSAAASSAGPPSTSLDSLTSAFTDFGQEVEVYALDVDLDDDQRAALADFQRKLDGFARALAKVLAFQRPMLAAFVEVSRTADVLAEVGSTAAASAEFGSTIGRDVELAWPLNPAYPALAGVFARSLPSLRRCSAARARSRAPTSTTSLDISSSRCSRSAGLRP